MRTFEFPQEAPVIGEHHHVELVAVRVSDKDVTSIYKSDCHYKTKYYRIRLSYET